VVALLLAGCSSMQRERGGAAQIGEASYYGKDFHGRKTASGEPFDMWDMTAAHRKLPLGTRVRVTNLANDRTVIVRINDRGPYTGKRIIDVSYAAARKLGMLERGVAHVRVEVLAP
jgi:rare lipoprotein A